MVGVPGRSKGCHACRKQKIRCSQERPECKICRTAGRECPGYQRDRIFVNLTASKDGLKASKPQTISTDRRVDNSTLKYGASNYSSESQTVSSSPFESSTDTRLVSQRCLTMVAYRQQLMSTFVSGYLMPPKRAYQVEVDERHWLPMLPGLARVSPALDVAAMAFCTAKLGRSARDKTLATESLKLYGRGLRELQRALFDSQQMYTDDTLGACVLLAMYEAFECPSGSRKGYISHVSGCSRLVRLRGPESYMHGLGHFIFTSYRFMATLESLASKQTFLEEPIWMTVPFQSIDKSPINRLLDLMLEAPGLMRTAEQLEHLPSLTAKFDTANSLLASLYDLERRLVAFYSEFKTTMNSLLYTEVIAPIDDLNTRALFPLIHQFDNIRTAGVMALYWSVMVLLSVAITRMRPLLVYLQSLMEVQGASLATKPESDFSEEKSQSNVPMVAPLAPIHIESSINDATYSAATPSITEDPHCFALPTSYALHDYAYYARQVCKTAPYCLAAENSDMGLGAITAPLHIVLETLSGFNNTYKEECDWIQAMLQRVKVKGLGIVAFLKGVSDPTEAI